MTEVEPTPVARIEPAEAQFRSPLRCYWETTYADGAWRVHRVLLDARGREVHRETSRAMLRDQVTQRLERDADLVTSALWIARFAVEGQAAEIAATADAVADQQVVQMARTTEARAKVERLRGQLADARAGAVTAPTGPQMYKYAGKLVPESEVPEHRRHLATPVDDGRSAADRLPVLTAALRTAEREAENEAKVVDELVAEGARLQEESRQRYQRARRQGDEALLKLRGTRVL